MGFCVFGEGAGADCLDNGEVGVGKIDVFADDGDGDVTLGVVDAIEQVAPYCPIDVTEGQS